MARFADVDTTGAELLASQAAIVLANAAVFQDSRALNENLGQALTSRATIDQAVGIILAGGGRSPDEAFQVLVRASQRENRKLATSPQRSWNGPRRPGPPTRPTQNKAAPYRRCKFELHTEQGRLNTAAAPTVMTLVVAEVPPVLHVTVLERWALMALSGEFDFLNSHRIASTVSDLVDQGVIEVTVDLSDVSFWALPPSTR